ncbi:hypothetical protein KIPB_004712, partial [Kipferlia bialata]
RPSRFMPMSARGPVINRSGYFRDHDLPGGRRNSSGKWDSPTFRLVHSEPPPYKPLFGTESGDVVMNGNKVQYIGALDTTVEALTVTDPDIQSGAVVFVGRAPLSLYEGPESATNSASPSRPDTGREADAERARNRMGPRDSPMTARGPRPDMSLYLGRLTSERGLRDIEEERDGSADGPPTPAGLYSGLSLAQLSLTPSSRKTGGEGEGEGEGQPAT